MLKSLNGEKCLGRKRKIKEPNANLLTTKHTMKRERSDEDPRQMVQRPQAGGDGDGDKVINCTKVTISLENWARLRS